MTLDEWRARYEQLEVETARLRAERDAAWAEAAELQALFGLQRTRMDAARALWQEAHPEKENVWPDLGDLLAWLMQERAVAKTFSQLDRAALAAAREERDAAHAYAARAGDARAVEALRKAYEAAEEWHYSVEWEGREYTQAVMDSCDQGLASAQPALAWLAQVKREAKAEALQTVKARLYALASREADQPYGHAMNPRQWAATCLQCAAEDVAAMHKELKAAALRATKETLDA